MSMKNFRVEDMKMKVSVAKDSLGGRQPSSAEQYSQAQSPQEQQRTQQVPDQQAGQESGQPEGQTAADEQSAEQSDEQSDDQEEDSAPTPPPAPVAVPSGTTAEILRWVGGDKARAEAALSKEKLADRPRSGLTNELEEILRG